MLKTKRMKLALLSLAAVAMLLCGWSAYAATSPTQATDTSVTGTLQALTDQSLTVHTESGNHDVPLAQSVWVYRNEQAAKLGDLVTGDQIDVFLNNKKQAAYIKATDAVSTSSATKAPAATAAPSTVPSSSPAPEALASVSVPPPASPAAPEPSNAPADKQPNTAPAQEDDVEVDVQGEHFNLHIGRTKDAKLELTIQAPHAGKFRLTGDDAQKWCASLLGAVKLSDPNAKQLLVQKLAAQYGMDACKLNVHVKADKPSAPKAPNGDPRQDRDTHPGRGADKPNHDKHDGRP